MRLRLCWMVLVCWIWPVMADGSARAEQLNVLFILVDDWGWTDAGALGSDYFETPNIDRFASGSLRFTQAYAAAPVCSPTRASILTGKFPARLDMTIWHEGAVSGGPQNRKLREAKSIPNLPREEVTLAELFKQRDYFTAHIGKWHLGKAAYYPETQGFDLNVGGTYWGAPATFFYPYRGPWSTSDPELRYVPVGLGQPGDYLTDRLTDHAVNVLRQRKDQPFFLNLWFHSVHTPIEAKPALLEEFRSKERGQQHRHATYAAMLASLDENIGRILGELDQLGIAERTVVVLTSDNGGVDFPTAKSDDQAPTSNAPLRSGKGTLYEGGIRVPLLVRWPGVTVAGQVCHEMVCSQDFLPTLADGCGFNLEAQPRIDGVSLMPLLRSPESSLGRTELFWHYPHYYPRMTPASAVRADHWKLIHYYEDDRIELYDLSDDLGESRNLAGMHSAKANELKAKLDRWREAVGANAPTSSTTR